MRLLAMEDAALASLVHCTQPSMAGAQQMIQYIITGEAAVNQISAYTSVIV